MSKKELGRLDLLCRGLAELQRGLGTGVVVLVNAKRDTRQALEEAGVCVICASELGE